MKIKSNLIFNTSLLARHSTSQKDGKVVIGGSEPEGLVIPAGATLELEDAKWKKFAVAAKPYLANGHLTMLEDVALTEAEQEAKDAADLEAAEKLAKELKAKAKKDKA